MSLGISDVAEHAAFGRGIVLAILPAGRVRVQFLDAPDLPRTVLRSDLRSGSPSVPSAGVVRAEAPGKPSPPEREAKTTVPQKTRSARSLRSPRAASVTATTSNASPAPRRTPPPAPLRPTAPPTSEIECAGRRLDAWQAIEAVRLGVVPARCVLDYTVGRDAAIRSLEALLEDCRGLRVLWGDYGAGKTHMLELTQARASELGVVTSRVTLNPAETPPTRPQRLYREIAKNIRLPGQAGVGLAALLDRLVESKDHARPGGSRASRFVSPYLRAVHAKDEFAASMLLDYLTGESVDRQDLMRAARRSGWRGPLPLTLSDYRTFGRVYLHLLGVLATWSRDAGFRGLLLLLDEVEYVESLSSSDRIKAQEVVDHFAAATLEESALSFDPETLYKGGHEVHRALPLRFREDQPLGVVMAATPFEELQVQIKGRYPSDAIHVPLNPLTQDDVIGMVGHIFKLYQRAYPSFRPGLRDLERLASHLKSAMRDGEVSTRALVRITVDKCDTLRLFAPNEALGTP